MVRRYPSGIVDASQSGCVGKVWQFAARNPQLRPARRRRDSCGYFHVLPGEDGHNLALAGDGRRHGRRRDTSSSMPATAKPAQKGREDGEKHRYRCRQAVGAGRRKPLGTRQNRPKSAEFVGFRHLFADLARPAVARRWSRAVVQKGEKPTAGSSISLTKCCLRDAGKMP